METRGVIVDSYVGSFNTASFIQSCDVTSIHPNLVQDNATEDKRRHDRIPRTKSMSSAWSSDMADNQTDEDKITNFSSSEEPRPTFNKMEEYNTEYEGLSIIPWEDFVANPRKLNDLFYIESNHKITYDPDEVNTFFHGRNVLPPTVGDISENGKSWNIEVDKVADLRQIRQMLSERCSVFGLTLVYRQKRFAKPQRAPCLLLLDPSQGTLGDRIYTALTKAMDALHRRRNFCVEININQCVEAWCRRTLLTECKSVGAKLVVTNGEEYTSLTETEDVVCCIVCFPIWLMQTCIYKLHRKVVYDDFFVTLDEEIFLHGTFLEPAQQRQQIFKGEQSGDVFRVRSFHQTDKNTLEDLGSYKFICVKKAKKEETNKDGSRKIREHSTLPFNQLMDRRKERVLTKESKIAKQHLDNEKTVFNKEELNKKVRFNDAYNDKQDDANTKQTNSVSRNHSVASDGGTINIAFDDEDQTIPAIPELQSQLFVDSDNTQGHIPNGDIEADMDNLGSLFVKKSVEYRSISPIILGNEAIVKYDSDDHPNKSTVSTFEWKDFDQSATQSESDEEPKVPTPQVRDSKENLLQTMCTIEKSIQVEKDSSVFKAKALDAIPRAVESPTESKKNTKKKGKEKKPKVGKVLKDLMKTTEATNDILPSQKDERYAEAKAKLKSKRSKKKSKKEKVKSKNNKTDNNKAHIKHASANLELSSKLEIATIDDSIMYFNDGALSSSSADGEDDSPESDQAHIHVMGKYDTQESMTNVEKLTIDEQDKSSTDGEIEMIYQSNSNHDNTTITSAEEVDDLVETSEKETYVSRPDFESSDGSERDNQQTPIHNSGRLQTDDDKQNRLKHKSVPNRSTLFLSSGSSAKRTPSAFLSSVNSSRSALSSADSEIEDLEISDVEDELPKTPAVPRHNMTSGLPSNKQMKKFPQRNTSQRKYLGAALSRKQASKH